MPENTSNNVVVFESEDGIGIIQLNRPEVHNAVNESVIEALETTLDEVDADDAVRALIITGAGPTTFCAGGDLQYFATLDTREKGLEMSQRMQVLLNRLWSGSKPVIAAINGQALGGGCEILTACHFRIAASTASFAYRQSHNGLITGWGGGARLFHLVGRTWALRLLLTGDRIDTPEALRIGLIDDVAEPEDLRAAAFAYAKKISRYSPGVASAILELARLHYRCDVDTAVQRETQLFGDRWTSDEFRDAINGFQINRSAKAQEAKKSQKEINDE